MIALGELDCYVKVYGRIDRRVCSQPLFQVGSQLPGTLG